MQVTAPALRERDAVLGRGRKVTKIKIARNQLNQAVHKAHKHRIDRVSVVQQRANQHHVILSDGNARRTDGDQQRLERKHVLTARRGEQRVTVTKFNM